MQVFLDGNPIAVPRPTLAAALAHGVDAADQLGRIVIEVKADGQPVIDNELVNPSDEPGRYGEVHLTSLPPRELVRNTLRATIETMGPLEEEQVRLAELIHTDLLHEAARDLSGVFATWQATKDCVSRGAAILHLDADTLTMAGTRGDTFGAASTRLLGHLKGVRTALEREDWSALADLLEVDLCAEARRWRTLLEALDAHIAHACRGAGGEP